MGRPPGRRKYPRGKMQYIVTKHAPYPRAAARPPLPHNRAAVRTVAPSGFAKQTKKTENRSGSSLLESLRFTAFFIKLLRPKTQPTSNAPKQVFCFSFDAKEKRLPLVTSRTQPQSQPDHPWAAPPPARRNARDRAAGSAWRKSRSQRQNRPCP